MSIFASIGRIASEFSAARARHLTERKIQALPPELRKDIGWPDAFHRDSGFRTGPDSWAGNR